MKKKHNTTITGKVVLFLMALVVISNITVGVISYQMHMNQSVIARAGEAERIAVTIARHIDGDRFEEIMRTLQKDDYWHEIQDYANVVAAELGTAYLYILDKNYDDKVTYFGEGTEYEPFELGETEEVETFAPEMFDTLRTGHSTRTGTYPSGEYGEMVSGFAAIFNSRGQVAGVVGVDFFFDDVKAEIKRFEIMLIVIVSAFLASFFLISTAIGHRLVGKPLTVLDEAAKRLAVGDMDINVNIQSQNEIGRLSRSFNQMADSMKVQIAALDAVSRGNLTVHVEPRGDKDVMGLALVQLLNNLTRMFGEINLSAEQVSIGSGQISGGAQTLAQGALEQRSAVEELSATTVKLNTMVKNNTVNAGKAKDSNNTAGDYLTESMKSMEKTLQSMLDIDESSKKITSVIKAIDDIAFQTNILALNASVEAARAGLHGKGFAVVAEEVRNLAIKSASAASETAALIEESCRKADEGRQSVEQTNHSLKIAAKHAQEAIRLVNEVAHASAEQEAAIIEFNRCIDQVSQIVRQNSAAAEESAAASEEMSGQSAALHKLVGQFRLKDESGFSRSEAEFSRSEPPR